MNDLERRAMAGLHMRDVFERHFAPRFLLDASPRTLKEIRTTIGYWERLTNDPILKEMDSDTLLGFRAALRNPANFARPAQPLPAQLRLPGFEPLPPESPRPLAKATVNKHLRHLAEVLVKLGPQGRGNMDALRVLEVVPWVEPLREEEPDPRDVTDEELDALYRACVVARYPLLLEKDVRPRHWWQALVVVAVTAGFRLGAILGLRWSGVDIQNRLLHLPAAADKCRRARAKPVSALVISHLVRIRTAAEPVFPWPHCERTFYRQWHRIQDHAGISPHLKVHDLKRACGTRYAASGASAWVVQRRLDHSSIATSAHYINASREEREAVDRLAVPAAFLEDFSIPPAACGFTPEP